MRDAGYAIGVSNTSAQLRALAGAGLAASRRDGVRIYYRLADQNVSAFVGQVQDFAASQVAAAEQAARTYLGDVGALEPVARDELVRRLHDGQVLVLDVRPEAEYAAGHIPGAVSMPHDQLAARLAELPQGADIVADVPRPLLRVRPRRGAAAAGTRLLRPAAGGRAARLAARRAARHHRGQLMTDAVHAVRSSCAGPAARVAHDSRPRRRFGLEAPHLAGRHVKPSRTSCDHVARMPRPRDGWPLPAGKAYAQDSVFRPENLLREARPSAAPARGRGAARVPARPRR
ncbi:MAG: rhodanese-like domain-containing protein [Streptosporangiaceae bacterium]